MSRLSVLCSAAALVACRLRWASGGTCRPAMESYFQTTVAFSKTKQKPPKLPSKSVTVGQVSDAGAGVGPGQVIQKVWKLCFCQFRSNI